MDDIYLDFQHSIRHIITRLKKDKSDLVDDLQYLSEYYLNKRLALLNGPVTVDCRIGAPIPYLAYWFSDAFGFKNRKVVDELGLALIYISIANCSRDDLIDSDTQFSNDSLISFSNIFYGKYFDIFKQIFPNTSKIWYILAESANDWNQYESWNHCYKHNSAVNALSKQFLSKSSAYLVAITLPTIAVTALSSGNEKEITSIFQFLQNYWMGWKILDDLKDWQEDLYKKAYNHSSLLYAALDRTDQLGIKLDENSIFSLLMKEDFLDKIYGSIEGFYLEANNSIAHLKSYYLKEFVRRQLEYNRSQMKYYVELAAGLYRTITGLRTHVA